MDDSKEKIEISKETIEEFKRLYGKGSFVLDDEYYYVSFNEYPNIKQLIDDLKKQNPKIEKEQIYDAFRPIYDITASFEKINEEMTENKTGRESWINKTFGNLLKLEYIDYKKIWQINGIDDLMYQMMPKSLSEAEKSKIIHSFSHQYIKDNMGDLIKTTEGNQLKYILDNEKFNSMIKLLKKDNEYSIQEMNNMDCLYDTILCFTDKYKEKKSKDTDISTNEPTFDTIKAILDKYTKQCTRPQDLLTDIPSRLFNLMKNDFLDEQQKEELIKLYDNNYKIKFEQKNNKRIEELKLQYPNLEQKIDNREHLSDEEFVAFKELISLYRANNGSFEEKHIDCLIKQYVNAKDLSKEDQNLIFRALEDKSTYFYKENGLNYNISVRNFKDSKDSGVLHLGSHCYSTKSVIINKLIRNNNILGLIETVFHENQHALQNKEMRNPNNTNFLIYDMCKMYVMRKLIGSQFQEKNYSNSELEIDARIAANVKTAEYMQKIGINTKDIVDSLQESLCSPEQMLNAKSIDTKLMQFVFQRAKSLKIDLMMLKNREKNMNDNDVIESSRLFQRTIKNFPEILESIPSLKMEFFKKIDENGKEFVVRKGNIQILSDYNEFCVLNNLQDHEIVQNEYDSADENETVYYQKWKDSANVEKAKLYTHILNNDAIITPAEIIKDMCMLPKLNIQNPQLMKIMDNIIKTEIIPGINKITNLVKKTDVDDERKAQVIQSIVEIGQFLNNNPKHKYADEIQKKLQILSYEMERKYNVDFDAERKKTQTNGKEELEYMEAIANEVPGTQITEAKSYVKLMIDKERKNNNLTKNNDLHVNQNR